MTKVYNSLRVVEIDMSQAGEMTLTHCRGGFRFQGLTAGASAEAREWYQGRETMVEVQSGSFLGQWMPLFPGESVEYVNPDRERHGEVEMKIRWTADNGVGLFIEYDPMGAAVE